MVHYGIWRPRLLWAKVFYLECIARKIAEHGIPDGFIGLEMNKRQYVARWIAELTEISDFYYLIYRLRK